ncbi:MAG: cardiolipin synthase [Bacteroidales bacterium]
MLSFVSEHGIFFLNAIYILTVFVIVLAVIQQKGDPTKTLAWTLFIILVPFVGIVLYALLGKNYRRDKMLSRKEISDQKQLVAMGKILWKSASNYQVLNNHFASISKMLQRSNFTSPTQYNDVRLLLNASEKYATVFNAIEQAQHHIHLEYYIIEEDSVGRHLQSLLIKKAKQGLEVRLIYDHLGSWGLSKNYLQRLIDNGVQVYPFLPVRLSLFKSKINHRNHRKIVVLDGKIGFVGGMNFAERYQSESTEFGKWRDTHVQLQGDAVAWLQAVFLLDWYFVSKRQLQNLEVYFPVHDITHQCAVQIASSGPDSDWASIMQTYFTAICSAQQKLYVATPYFIPNESMLTALCTAALRGVDVRLLMSERTDSSITQWASMSFVDTMLAAGVKVYLYRKGFSHSKILIADGEFCSVGTANMDVRSFEYNFEVNALFYDRNFTQQVEKAFLQDLVRSRKVSLQAWKSRTKRERFMENIARLLAPML